MTLAVTFIGLSRSSKKSPARHSGERRRRRSESGRSPSSGDRKNGSSPRHRHRLIVSWSQHERHKVLELGLDGMLAEESALRYRDGNATAKRWQRAFHTDSDLIPTRSGRLHSLANYMNVVDYELPEESYGADRTGAN